MKTLNSLIFIIFVCSLGHTQIVSTRQMVSPYSETSPRLSEMYELYQQVSSSADTSENDYRKQMDRWFYLNGGRMHVTNDSTFDLRGYSKAFKILSESETLCSSDPIANWQSVGPHYVGQRNGWVSAIYQDPTDTNIILIGARVAGIFKTTDHGVTWNCVTDSILTPVLGVRQIVSSPFNSDYLLAVTGNESGLDAVQAGFLISTDGGDSWSVGSNFGAQGDVFQWICFDPNTSGMVYAVLDKELIYSQDNGQSWQGMNLPSELAAPNDPDEVLLLDKVLISDSSIFITNGAGGYVGFWKGEFYGSPSSLGVSWGSNLADSLNIQDSNLLIDDNNYGVSHSMNDASFVYAGYNKLDYRLYANSIGCGYDTSNYTYPHYGPGSTGLNSPFQGYDWSSIKTNGWRKDTLGGIVKLTCYDDIGAEQNFAEAISFKIPTTYSTVYSNTSVLELDFFIPRGAKLKVAVSPYMITSNSFTNHPGYLLCNIPDFDYGELFENVLYESDYYSNDTVIAEVNSIDFSNNFLDAMYINPYENGTTFNYYLILDFNDNYDSITQPKFVLNKFDVRSSEFIPNYVNVSNVAGSSGERFFTHVRGNDFSAIYRTMDGGTSFEAVEVESIGSTGTEKTKASYAKQELIASLLDSNVFYHAVIDFTRYTIGMVNQEQDITGNGYHMDCRSSYITERNGRDQLLWGNDGGIAKTINGLQSVYPGLESLNGDLSINMIYNLDVIDTSKHILIGLQDNGSKLFEESELNWISKYDGDGCVTMLRSNGDYSVAGDPQSSGSGALGDRPDSSGIVDNGIDIDDYEPYLGMRLEKYRFSDTTFIVGLNKHEDANGKVLINTGIDTYVKVQVPNSNMIGSIAICQRDLGTIYVADQIYKGDTSRLEKIFKTTNGGLDSNDWIPLDPYVRIYGGTDSVLLSIFKQWDYVNALAVDPISPDVVYAGLSGIGDSSGVVVDEFFRVLRSTDGGASFDDWSEGLPALPVNFLLTIESGNHLIFCATDAGVYYRMDGLDTWECFNNGLPKTRITDLAYKYCSKELYASTYGRGVWKTKMKLSTSGAAEQVISTNTTWSQDLELHDDLIIDSNVTLTITSEVHIDADRKIIIKPGGRLILDGALLTNACGTFWSGIEVWGHSNLPQYAINQGTLTMINDATIEFAQNAVQLWKPNNWSATGGIVRATTGVFRNNQRDIDLIDYDWSLSGVGQPNKSYFLNCLFETDSNYQEAILSEHARLYHVYGVRFLNCDFVDQRPDADYQNRGKGIFSMDAKYKVLGTYTGGSYNTVEYYNDSLYDVCTFTGLTAGVHALNFGSSNTITVDHASFTDCEYGVHLQLVDDAMITRNKFNRTEGSDWFGYQYDIYANKSTGFQIEGNVVTTEYDYEPSVGITIRESGQNNNIVYKNEMDGILIGSFAASKNRNNTMWGGTGVFKGLSFDCNQNFENSIYDELFYSNYGTDGVRLRQGSSTKAAGNAFSDDQEVNYQIYSTMNHNVVYHFYNSGSQILASGSYTNNILPNSSANNTCPTQFDVSKPGPGKPLSGGTISSMSSAFTTLSSSYTVKLHEYDSLLAIGDDEELHDMVNEMTTNADEVRSTLLAVSPYVSRSMLFELADQSPDLFSEEYLIEIIKQNYEVAHDIDFINYLLNKTEPISQEGYEEIVAGLGSFTDRGVRLFELVDIQVEMDEIIDMLVRDIVQDSLGADIEDFSEWVNKREDIISERKMLEMYQSVGDLTSAAGQLSSLASHISSLNDAVLEEEMTWYADLKEIVLDSVNSRGTIEELTEYLDSVARFYADSTAGYSQVAAQNLLCFFLGECAPAPEPYYVLAPISVDAESDPLNQSPYAHSHLFDMFPNPTSDQVTIVLSNLDQASLEVLNMEGRTILQRDLDQRTTLNVSDLEKGIYLIRVYSENGQSQLKKLVIQ